LHRIAGAADFLNRLAASIKETMVDLLRSFGLSTMRLEVQLRTLDQLLALLPELWTLTDAEKEELVRERLVKKEWKRELNARVDARKRAEAARAEVPEVTSTSQAKVIGDPYR
jgi:hypothetical protein